MAPEFSMVPALSNVYPAGIVNVLRLFIVSASLDNMENDLMFVG